MAVVKKEPVAVPAKPEGERVQDTRVIVKGVQALVGGEMHTFAGDKPEDLDALEKALTPEQCKRLKESGALEGKWRGTGKPAAPMQGSKLDRASPPGADAVTSKQHATLIAENARLKAELAKHADKPAEPPAIPESPEPAGDAEEHPHKRGRKVK